MRKRINYTKEQVEEIVKNSFSVAEVLRQIGYNTETGGPRTRLFKKFIEWNIDTSHFTGQLWAKGKTSLSDPRCSRIDLTRILSENSLMRTSQVKKILLKEKLIDDKCGECDLVEWRGIKLSLELHHKSGNSRDNRLENLILLCPNCHSITATWRGRNAGANGKKVSDADLLTALETCSSIHTALISVGLAAKGGNYKRCHLLKQQLTLS